jgi:adenosine deaminase
MMRRTAFLFTCFALAAVPAALTAQASAPEARATHAYQAAVQAGPLALRAFLEKFPKGVDLHVHLSGAVYAESFLREAAEDKLCIDPAALKFARNDQDDPLQEPCRPPLVPAARLTADQQLYDRLVDAFSMRGFVPSPGFSGHDQFFSTFDRFGGLGQKHIGEWVDEVASRAAAQNQQYIEPSPRPRGWPTKTR